MYHETASDLYAISSKFLAELFIDAWSIFLSSTSRIYKHLHTLELRHVSQQILEIFYVCWFYTVTARAPEKCNYFLYATPCVPWCYEKLPQIFYYSCRKVKGYHRCPELPRRTHALRLTKFMDVIERYETDLQQCTPHRLCTCFVTIHGDKESASKLE